MRFSSGVPVSTKANGDASDLTLRAVLVGQFLMRCASSRITTSGLSRWLISSSVPHHLLVVDQREEGRLRVKPQALGTQTGDDRTPRSVNGRSGPPIPP